MQKVWKDYGAITLGTILIGLATKNIFDPANMVTGGVSGVAIIGKELWGLPLWVTNTVLNIPLFLAGFKIMGWKVDKLELVLKKMAQALAANTNYAAMISGPSYHKTKLKFIQLSRVEANKLLVVVVVEGNIIKNTMIDIGEDLGEQELLNLNILLNSSLNGLTIEEINLGIISKLKEDAGIHSKVIELVLNEVAEAIKAGGEDLQIYTSGATNIFRYPELAEGEKASKLIGTLEQKEVLQEFVSDVNADQQGEGGIQVYIGDETPIQSMKDCSVVTANYDLGGGLRGTVGIIGPKRMDYEKVLGTLKNLMNQLDAAFKKDER